MTVTELDATAVVGGADTHANTIHITAIDAVGRELGDRGCRSSAWDVAGTAERTRPPLG